MELRHVEGLVELRHVEGLQELQLVEVARREEEEVSPIADAALPGEAGIVAGEDPDSPGEEGHPTSKAKGELFEST